MNISKSDEPELAWKKVYPKAMEEIVEFAEHYVMRVNKANGWFDESRSMGDEVALIHSEVSEMLEAYRVWGYDDATPESDSLDSPLMKPEGVGSEVADVFIRLLDFCYRHNVDLSKEFFRKMAYNETRGYRHGGKKI